MKGFKFAMMVLFSEKFRRSLDDLLYWNWEYHENQIYIKTEYATNFLHDYPDFYRWL